MIVSFLKCNEEGEDLKMETMIVPPGTTVNDLKRILCQAEQRLHEESQLALAISLGNNIHIIRKNEDLLKCEGRVLILAYDLPQVQLTANIFSKMKL